ncbi:X-linked PEST-containing transporter [Intoshia linei]|uniref:X-linked PEST-containing transporter n=1 Tax=Intoshia linei TaxID=1819745 RepID=A0A177BAA8_9BILA|nr:X-linked PEST-containing transporter [Intoshia linei]
MSAIANGVICGFVNSYSLLYMELGKIFHENANVSTISSLIGSIQLGTLFIMSAVSSMLISKIGLRKTAGLGTTICICGCIISYFSLGNIYALIFTYGITIGFGSSLVYTASLSILFQYFEENVGLASGIANFGGSVATVLFPYFLDKFIKIYGMSKFMLLEAFLYCFLYIGLFFWVAKESSSEIDEVKGEIKMEDDKISQSKSKSKFNKAYIKKTFDIFYNFNYRAWSITLSILFISYAAPFLYLTKYAAQNGMENSSIIISFLGGGSAVGRLVIGKISDHKLVDRIVLHQLCALLYGLCMFVIPIMISNSIMLYVMAIFLGVADGLLFSLIGPISKDILGSEKASKGMGCAMSLLAVNIIFGPILMGMLKDCLNRYDIIFYIAAIPPLISAFSMLIAHKK